MLLTERAKYALREQHATQEGLDIRTTRNGGMAVDCRSYQVSSSLMNQATMHHSLPLDCRRRVSTTLNFVRACILWLHRALNSAESCIIRPFSPTWHPHEIYRTAYHT